jgi:SAM-dependent methyltransferase
VSDSKQAEKTYLGLTGSSAWERAKPFSHPGADTLADSAQLLHDFAVAMMALQPAPDDLILDLGAGGCWVSDLLGRLHRRSIAVDISLEMLHAGRSRPGGAGIRAAAGDMEALPFRTGTFQKAVCLSALHHVPDMRAAIHEIGRVLTDDGMALFSEPGRGHAQAAVSTAAMRDFGVLEQEVRIAEFAAAASEAGFRDVRIKTLAYSIPAFDLTPDEWRRWARLAASKRPLRALQKLGRAALEFFGLGKRGVLFEEAFGMSMVRTLRHAMEDHPIILASKKPLPDARIPVARRAYIDVEAPRHARPGGTIAVKVRVINRGTAAWDATRRSATGQVRLGVQLLGEDGRLIARDHHRVDLPADVPPGASTELLFECPAPADAGSYMLKFDVVAEGVTWFETGGSPVVTRTLTVL